MFDASKSYGEMLKKIAFGTLIMALIDWHIILVSFPGLSQVMDNMLKSINVNTSIKLTIPGLPYSPIMLVSFIVPCIIAYLCRMFKLHDRISDLFKFRINYDINNIILPLCEGVNLKVSSLDVLKQKRNKIMYEIFYKYAGYDKNIIDAHKITAALDSLSWFWIMIEGIAINCITFYICIWSNNIKTIRFLVVLLTILIILAVALNKLCKKNTRAEVNLILNDTTRKSEILESLNKNAL